jgi:hypothetical protein
VNNQSVAGTTAAMFDRCLVWILTPTQPLKDQGIDKRVADRARNAAAISPPAKKRSAMRCCIQTRQKLKRKSDVRSIDNGFSKQSLSRARAVLVYSRELAE